MSISASDLDLQLAELRRQCAELVLANAKLQRENVELSDLVGRLEEKLRNERAFLRRMVDHLPIAYSYLDRDLVYRMNNSLHSAVLGIPAEQILDRPIFEVLPWLRDQTENIYQQVLRTGEPARFTDFRMTVHRNGQELETYWDLNYIPVYREGYDGVDGLLFLGLDVTKRHEIERLQREQIEHLREIDRIKGDFVNAASHELRTPVSAIMGYAEFLLDQIGGQLTSQQQDFVAHIERGAKRLARLIDDLLDFAKLEAGSFVLSIQEADLVGLIAQELACCWPIAAEAGVELEHDVQAAVLALPLDPHRTGQV
ncbi:MAG: PAS domain-containing protein, partial [Cyanobacteria bacterium REEB65]|nr:PAS domain-containing protein [Cyanobacteria bacterium REEB65]